MDLKLDPEKRDLAQSIQGWPVPITGEEEQAQRIRLRLMIPKGSFRLDPELGSRLYRLPRGTGSQMEEYARGAIEEALSPMPGVRLTGLSCRYDPQGDRAFLDCRFACGRRSVEMTVEA